MGPKIISRSVFQLQKRINYQCGKIKKKCKAMTHLHMSHVSVSTKRSFQLSSSAAFFFLCACHCCWADTNKAHRKTCNHISISICCCLYYLDISMYMEKCLRIYTLLRTFQVSEKPQMYYIWSGGGADSFSHNEKFEIAPYQKPQRYTRQQHSLKMDWLQIEFWNCYQIHWTSMIQRGGGPAGVFRL